MGDTLDLSGRKVPGKKAAWYGAVRDVRQVRAQKYNNVGTTYQWGNMDIKME